MKKILILSMLLVHGAVFAEEEHRGHGAISEHHEEQHMNESRPMPPKIEMMSHPRTIEEKISNPQRRVEAPGRPNQFSNEGHAPISSPDRRFQSPSPLFHRGAEQVRFNNREEFLRFHANDIRRWQTGRWVEGRVHGVFGWYWLIPGLGYYYFAEPVFPYPDPYLFYQNPELVVFYQENSSEAIGYTRPANETPAYWYFCRSANMYYPYVAQCPEEWEVIPVK